MRYQLPNGQLIGEYQAFTYNDIQYPENWTALATQEERAALGLTEVQEVPRADDRFYMNGDVNTPKDIDQLKTQWVGQAKQTAGSLLAQTDWMVIRKAERDVAIPAETVAYRAAVVAECSRLETAIAGCADVPALIAVVNSQNWPE